MKKVRIFCNSLCLLEEAHNSYVIDQNNYLEFFQSSETYFKCYPLDQKKTSLPFCFLLKNDKNNIVSNCSNIKIYNLLDRCDIFVEPFKIYSNKIVDSTSFTLKNSRYSVTCYEDRIKITCMGLEYIFETNIESASFDTQNGFINILTVFEDKKNYTRFDTTVKKFFNVYGDKIQIQDDVIITQQNFDDAFFHTKVNRHKNNNTLEFESADLYTQNQDKQKQTTQSLVPYVFFENIKLQDYLNATSLLSENLKQILTPLALKDFFGEIKEISVYSLNPLVYTLYGQNTATDYNICLQDGKISEIESI